MSNRETTTQVIDEIIKFAATSSTIAVGLMVPNVLIGLEAPLKMLYRKLDSRERERELRRIVSNMKSQGYLAGTYAHGLQLTEKARTRLRVAVLNELRILPVPKWDRFWRIVLYDIPEDKKSARNEFNSRLRLLGCFQLQRSVWITPFPCREVVEAVAVYCSVDECVTYFEARNLDNERTMTGYFKKKYPSTSF